MGINPCENCLSVVREDWRRYGKRVKERKKALWKERKKDGSMVEWNNEQVQELCLEREGD